MVFHIQPNLLLLPILKFPPVMSRSKLLASSSIIASSCINFSNFETFSCWIRIGTFSLYAGVLTFSFNKSCCLFNKFATKLSNHTVDRKWFPSSLSSKTDLCISCFLFLSFSSSPSGFSPCSCKYTVRLSFTTATPQPGGAWSFSFRTCKKFVNKTKKLNQIIIITFIRNKQKTAQVINFKAAGKNKKYFIQHYLWIIQILTRIKYLKNKNFSINAHSSQKMLILPLMKTTKPRCEFRAPCF